MSHTGWRKPTPGLCRANALATYGERMSVPKTKALLAVRRVASAIGLKPGDVLLLDTLAAFTKADDWIEGARPLVWPSNVHLVDVTGLSVSGVKRHLRKLVELGLITCKDSPNGKRWGRRDEAGRIVEAYGFDLAPLAARTPEFEKLYELLRAERDRIKQLKREFTILRRSVWSLIQSARLQFDETFCTIDPEFWNGLRQRYETLMSGPMPARLEIEELEVLCVAFAEIHAEAEQRVRMTDDASKLCENRDSPSSSSDWKVTSSSMKMNPKEFNSELVIQVTNQPQPVRRNCDENEEVADTGCITDFADDAASGRPEATRSDTSPGAIFEAADFVLSAKSTAAGGPRRPAIAQHEVTIEAVMFACPDFTEMVHGLGDYVRNWRELIVAAERIRPMIGISVDAWESAKSMLGSHGAAAAIAIITDKYSEGSVSSPGGYLRGLCQKALAGELQLARSVYGRLAERQGRMLSSGAGC